jgi:hypothetical protein
MAGLAGYVTAAPETVAFDRALAALCHHASHRTAIEVDEPCLRLGSNHRSAAPPSVHSIASARLTVLAIGAPVLRVETWRPATAELIAKRYLDSGDASLSALDGSYLVAVLDRERGSLVIVNDRLASVPLVYWAGEGRFAFAPEAKAVFAMADVRPSIDASSAAAFLNLGYPIGHRTMFEGICHLEAAHQLTVDLRSGVHRSERYWDLRFTGGRDISKDEAAAALDGVMKDALNATLADSPANVRLLLTGGWDSRALLGVMASAGRPPDSTLTWGLSRDIAESDASIAQGLAGAVGVPNQLLTYDADGYVRHATEWVRVSELSSDNAGSFAAGADFLHRHVPGIDVVFTGDQAFGAGGLATTRAEAIENLTQVPFGRVIPEVATIATADGKQVMGRMFREQVEQIANGAPAVTPKDLQDYLFLHIYVSRWLCAAAYFREPMVTVRRPMLMGSVLDFVGQLPAWLRADKRVLTEFLRRKTPHLLTFPKASANSLVDWNYDSRTHPRLRDFLGARLSWHSVRNTPMAGLLDERRFSSAVLEFFSTSPAPISRTPSAVPKIYSLRSALSRNSALRALARQLEPVVKRSLGLKPQGTNTKVMMRLAMLTSLQSEIDRGSFSSE